MKRERGLRRALLRRSGLQPSSDFFSNLLDAMAEEPTMHDCTTGASRVCIHVLAPLLCGQFARNFAPEHGPTALAEKEGQLGHRRNPACSRLVD